MVPVFKHVGERSTPNNYHPVSLLPCLAVSVQLCIELIPNFKKMNPAHNNGLRNFGIGGKRNFWCQLSLSFFQAQLNEYQKLLGTEW